MPDNNSNIVIDETSATVTVFLDCDHDFEMTIAIPSAALRGGVFCPTCMSVQEIDSIDPDVIPCAHKDLSVEDVEGVISAGAYVDYHPEDGSFSASYATTTPDGCGAESDDITEGCQTIEDAISDVEDAWASLDVDDECEDE